MKYICKCGAGIGLFIVLILTGMSDSAFAQIYYVSGDTLWEQESTNSEPLSIADGTTLPIYAVEADTAGGYLYWAQDATSDSEIFRAELDNPENKEVIYGESGSVRGLAIDNQNQKLYWTDLSNTGEILRANLDGTEVESLVAGESDGDTDGILDIALDVENQKMYWVITGAVMRANLDGTEVEVVTEITSYVQPQGIEVNTESGHVYWTDSSSEEIMRAPIDGSNVESIINADSPSALSLDADNGKLYWVEDYTFSGGGGAIYRANTDGSEIEIVRELSWTRSALFVSGWDMATSSEEESFSDLPKEVILESNYPNPFNPQTIIQYQLPEAMAVKLTVYNFLGQNVHSLLNGEMQTSGAHRVVFDAENLPSGTYFYRLETEAGSVTGKMTLIK